MTSEERHIARRKRREEKRRAKRLAKLSKYDNFERITNRDALARAAEAATHGVRYKDSVKRYMIHKLINITRTSRKLEKQQDICKGFICFTLMERGKLRRIMSVHFSERVVQKALNAEVLIPMLTNSLVYDNGASRRGMGTNHANKRLVKHLCKHYRRYGTKGYILLIDFTNYFGNINHEKAKEIVKEHFTDERIIWLFNRFVDSYYEHYLMEGKRAGTPLEEIEARGLGLGSEINQTVAISYANKLDHYIREELKVGTSGRYMDDTYLIHESKEYLQYCLSEIKRMCKELDIVLNEKKTVIVKLTHGFTFLKTQYRISSTGKIVRKPCRKAIVRERRKLKKQKILLDSGIMTFEQVRCSYASWRGCMVKRDAHRTVSNMDRLFNNLFIRDWILSSHIQRRQ